MKMFLWIRFSPNIKAWILHLMSHNIPPYAFQKVILKLNFNLNSSFCTSSCCLKRFYKGLKGLHKTFKVPQRSVKTKICYFFPSSGTATGRVRTNQNVFKIKIISRITHALETRLHLPYTITIIAMTTMTAIYINMSYQTCLFQENLQSSFL